MSIDFDHSGTTLTALPSGALWWAERRLLCVADLHLGKSERLARRGGALLPPYEVQETLTRLQADIEGLGPATVICLGDSFDDDAAATGLPEGALAWIARLQAGRRWVWIAGNHDPAPLTLAGTHLGELQEGPLRFRHIAAPGACGEVSGHYHPKARLAGKARACFLFDASRVILPAYGAYTGGLWCDGPELASLMGAEARAILRGPRLHMIPMPRLRQVRARRAG
ncbi:ligase-associated DNA damage response endonuclease PdeM [Halodurantibacterium flavum]|uniref:Ligase-associated DNA damage response endonuclease PdeM n=1 Tax=Halodurantibacterium flavum TaxID=1382802 RepID=A0ABW4S8M8_9RHOB